MSCPLCASGNQGEFGTEMRIHFRGLKNLAKPIAWLFPILLVCLDCGFSRFTIPETELTSLREGSARQLEPLRSGKRMYDPFAPNRPMAQVGRAGPLQLLRGTRELRGSGRVSESGARALVAYSSPPEPEAPDQLDAYPCIGYAMASSAACAPSLSGCSLRCHSSEIRTGCANQRPSGSVRGLCQEDEKSSCCTKDGGGPSGAAL